MISNISDGIYKTSVNLNITGTTTGFTDDHQ